MGEAPPLNSSGSNYSAGMADDCVVSSGLWSRENSNNFNVEEVMQRIEVSDDMMMIGGESDSFLVDLERFSGGGEKDVNAISRLKRSISRKMNQQSGGNLQHHYQDTSIGVASVCPSSYSPTSAATQTALNNNTITPEKPLSPRRQPVVGPTTDGYQLPHHQHHITIKTAHIPTNTSTSAEIPTHITRWGTRRFNSFKRTPPSCFSDPKRVLLFFATLSSIGTIMLIFFTLSIGMTNDSGTGGV